MLFRQLEQIRRALETLTRTFNGLYHASDDRFKPKGAFAAMSHNADRAFRQPNPMPACAYGRQAAIEEGQNLCAAHLQSTSDGVSAPQTGSL